MHFPFSAIVGQETLKRALRLCVIQPRLGGVLIRGTKGVAKSTAVRALAALLPPIDTVAGCPFQRRPGEVIQDWPLPVAAAIIQRPVPLIELPLGASEDRVLGALHLERALRGERVLEPGLLAAANRGVLYIDEVNLLADHLVDLLLDAAASGVHRLEREGLSLTHPAEFILVGTMNPEEGELRPQLLDRFGLAVDVTDLADPAERAEAVRRRLAFEADPGPFQGAWQAAEDAERERLVQAQRLLPRVEIDAALVATVSARCLAESVEGLRADLTMCRAAAACAAYQGRTQVEPADVDAVAELALAHRRRPPPPPPFNGAPRPGPSGSQSSNVSDTKPSSLAGTVQEGSAGPFITPVQPPHFHRASSPLPGRRRKTGEAKTRNAGPVRIAKVDDGKVAWAATLRAAALRGAGGHGLDSEDLRFWPRTGPGGGLLLFVLDTSGSMAAWRRMRQTKSAVLSLLLQGYQRRDRVALLAFRDQGAELALRPTPSLRTARRILEGLPAGGATPLAHGLAAAQRFLQNYRRRQPHQPIWTVLLTDGRANVGLRGDPWQDALEQARGLADCNNEILVVDTETHWPRFARAAVLAQILGAACHPLEQVLARPLPDPWRCAV